MMSSIAAAAVVTAVLAKLYSIESNGTLYEASLD